MIPKKTKIEDSLNTKAATLLPSPLIRTQVDELFGFPPYDTEYGAGKSGAE